MIFASLKTAFNVGKSWAVQHSPELLLTTSIVAGVGATVTGCIATKKMEAINAKHKEILDILHQNEDKESKEYKKSVTKEYGRYWFDIAKAWAPCVSLTLLSGTAAIGSFKIVSKRLIAAETAFAGVTKAFEQYRDNVIEDQGLEKDEYYANNGALKKKQELIAKGKYKEKSLPSEVIESPKIAKVDDIFHYYFCEDNVKRSCYSKYPYYNMRLLCQAQTMFDSKLRDPEGCGALLLDDVYDYLGLDKRVLYSEKAQGRTYGWTLDCYAEDGQPNDQHVLFGIYEYNDTQHRLFRNGDINDVILHFNCRLLTKETCELLAKG